MTNMNTMAIGPAVVREELSRILRSAVFSELDRHFASFIGRQETGDSKLSGFAAALVSYQLARGHIFLDLARAPAWESGNPPLRDWPGLPQWTEDLRNSSTVGAPGETKPLLLTHTGKLYLQRYWSYENLLAEKLRAGASLPLGDLPPDARLEDLFGDAEEQKEAARNALRRQFSLISGGPGTGKTTTVLKILLLMLEHEPELSMQLAAPTGKAAARLQESVREGLMNLKCDEATRKRLAEAQASTVHRLLGTIPGSVTFRHHAANPLPADVVVLDEASMVDLPLMAKLFDALPSTSRLIILGDKDQLASVEAGSVLSGIVEAALETPPAATAPPLEGAATLLVRNFRFGNKSSIFRVCNAIRAGDIGETLAALRGGDGADVTIRELPEAKLLKDRLRPRVVAGHAKFLLETDPARALEAFSRFQILTALRNGPYGKGNVNHLVEEILREEGLILPGQQKYPGQPLMVTENDYAVRLFNGDTGVMLKGDDGNLTAFFRSEDGTIRSVPPLRLPFAEPAFAMTVHKSQGSEFEEVLIILPSHDTPVLTRELLYTAISRARTKVELWCSEEILTAAVSRKVARASGLSEMLAGS